MSAITSTVTLNAAFLQEIKQDSQDLQRLLVGAREILLSRRQSFSCRRLHQIVEDLCDQLATHFALEEAFGYFDDPLSVAPQLSRKADMLRSQHASLFCQLRAVGDDLDRLAEQAIDQRLLDEVASSFQDFDEKLREHESAENDLILEAFDDDIGVGD